MTNPSDKSRPTGHPELSELFARYLHGQVGSHEAGLAMGMTGEVVPHEAAPTQPADPKLAWHESLAVLPYYESSFSGGSQNNEKTLKAPPDWPALVAAQEPAMAVPFCLGNFPQMVRALQPLLHLTAGAHGTRFASFAKTTHAPSVASAELIRWADQIVKRKQFPDSLLAVAALRLARDFEGAAKLIPDESEIPAEWRAAWENERAALAWHQGQTKEALASWQAQKESTPVLFNRGMACLFTNQRADARAALQKAVAHLPEDDAWHHLGRLYLALAEM
jgi:hypothetical protein